MVYPTSSEELGEQSVPDLQGEHYHLVLSRFHELHQPKNYFEIGTETGATLALARCRSISVDPKIIWTERNMIGSKEFCSFYQLPSDTFFEKYDPSVIFGQPIDMAFLDGMHRCEFLLRDFANTERYCQSKSIIMLHDCLPVETTFVHREGGMPSIEATRNGWWTGDVWRTLMILKHHRRDLLILTLDAQPTGLVCITNLNPTSHYIKENYRALVEEMMSLDFSRLRIEDFFQFADVLPTSKVTRSDEFTKYFY